MRKPSYYLHTSACDAIFEKYNEREYCVLHGCKIDVKAMCDDVKHMGKHDILTKFSVVEVKALQEKIEALTLEVKDKQAALDKVETMYTYSLWGDGK